MKVTGCHSCPFFYPREQEGYLCRHPQFQLEFPITREHGARYYQESLAFNTLLEAAQLELLGFVSGKAVYGMPGGSRPGYPAACPLRGSKLVVELDV